MLDIKTKCDTYDKYKNLKLAADELGMKWQTLYVDLCSVNHPVTGDKKVYGSPTDKMAKKLEDYFKELVPHAIDHNETSFQSKVDFTVNNYLIDIKASTKKDGYKNNSRKNPAFRWTFSTKVQGEIADFIVCFCMQGTDCEDHGDVEKILLIPKEMFKNKQSMSVSCAGSKWDDFSVTIDDLKEFFKK